MTQEESANSISVSFTSDSEDEAGNQDASRVLRKLLPGATAEFADSWGEPTQDQVNERLKNKGFLALDVPKDLDLAAEIKRLKKKKNAVLLAHYYQEAVIQELADYLGDSLYLAQAAQKVSAEIIVFSGVHFMAETAKIINPNKKVILPLSLIHI